jgi:hypothetical protein
MPTPLEDRGAMRQHLITKDRCIRPDQVNADFRGRRLAQLA